MPNYYYKCQMCGFIDIRTTQTSIVKLAKEKCACLSGNPPKPCGGAWLPLAARDPDSSVAVDPAPTANPNAGLNKDEVLTIYQKRGLWVRSVQHTAFQYCLNADPIDDKTLDIAKATGKWQGGSEEVFIDAWSLIHPEIKMVLFQMGKDNPLRNVALLVDWALTADRYLNFSTKDKSSNKKVSDKDVLAPPSQCKQELMAQIAKAEKNSGGSVGEHNEVNTIQINEDALVAFVYSNTNGCPKWDPDGKQLMIAFVKQIKSAAPRAPKRASYPVFTYEDGKMTFLDTV